MSYKSILRSWSWRPSFLFSPIIVWQGRQSHKVAFPRILDLLTNGQLVAGQVISEKCFQDIWLESAGSRSVLAWTMGMYGFHRRHCSAVLSGVWPRQFCKPNSPYDYPSIHNILEYTYNYITICWKSKITLRYLHPKRSQELSPQRIDSATG